jgi:RecA/RadA recombinase
MADEKAKLIEAAISQIEKDYGKGSIMRLGNRDVLVPVSVIPTGCLSLGRRWISARPCCRSVRAGIRR